MTYENLGMEGTAAEETVYLVWSASAGSGSIGMDRETALRNQSAWQSQYPKDDVVMIGVPSQELLRRLLHILWPLTRSDIEGKGQDDLACIVWAPDLREGTIVSHYLTARHMLFEMKLRDPEAWMVTLAPGLFGRLSISDQLRGLVGSPVKK